MAIPVFLFTGFLESGKTKMVSETMADKRFQNKERTLILVCEEGIEEYDVSQYNGQVFVEIIEDPSELTTENLPMRTVMKHLTHLETGKFIVILPGGKVMRKY